MVVITPAQKKVIQGCVADIREVTSGPGNFYDPAGAASGYATPTWKEVLRNLEDGILPSSYSSYLEMKGIRGKDYDFLGDYLEYINKRLEKNDFNFDQYRKRFNALFQNEKFKALLFKNIEQKMRSEVFRIRTDEARPSLQEELLRAIETRRNALKNNFVESSEIRGAIDQAAETAKGDLPKLLEEVRSDRSVNPWHSMVCDIKEKYQTVNQSRHYLRREILPTFLGGISPYREAELECLTRIVQRLTALRIQGGDGGITTLEGYKLIVGTIDLLIKHTEETSGTLGRSELKTLLEAQRKTIMEFIKEAKPAVGPGSAETNYEHYAREFITANREHLQSTIELYPPAKNKEARKKQQTGLREMEVLEFMTNSPRPKAKWS